MEVERYVGLEQRFDPIWLEEIILIIADKFDIRISWDRNTAILTGVCAVAGGVIGSYAGGRVGAAIGTGLGSAAGFGVASMVSLRNLWETIKNQLQELLYIVFNYLRRLNPNDIVDAFTILMACRSSKRELVYAILEFVAMKLSRDVICNITAG